MGCHPLSPVRLPLSVSLSVALCLPLSGSPSLGVPARSCLSVCLHLHLHLPSRRLGSLSLNLHLFPSLSLLTPGLPSLPLAPASHGWVLWLWPWLTSLRRPAVSLGVGARECVCVPVRVAARRSSAPSARSCAWRAAWGQGGGGPRWGEGAGLTSSGRRRWWLQVGLGTAQVPGRMGAQGHGWAAPRPAGGSEDRGPQRAPRPWAANALGRWARGGGGAAVPEPGGAWRVPGWESAKTSAPLTPPSPLHAPAGTPGRLLPVPEALWSPGPGRPSVGRG